MILGGENTHLAQIAYSYFRSIKDTLENNKITSGLNLYSVYYDFGSSPTCRDGNFDRLSLFYKFRDPQRLAEMSGISETELATSYPLYGSEPQYINDIYKIALQPRLYTKNGQLLSTEQIAKNLRNMIVFTHCHGAYVVRMLEQKMLADPILGAQLLQTPKLLQNLLVINHEPFAPLEKCKFTSLSFGSASDRQAGLYTELDYQMKSAPDRCAPAFFGPEFGNIMIADQLKHDICDEHSHIGLRGSEFTDAKLTRNGKLLFTTERNALLKGVRAMLKGKPMPTIPQMLTTKYASYEELKRRGMQIYRHFRTH